MLPLLIPKSQKAVAKTPSRKHVSSALINPYETDYRGPEALSKFLRFQKTQYWLGTLVATNPGGENVAVSIRRAEKA
jgi:hypothetical protein